jgi:hypothetical protein
LNLPETKVVSGGKVSDFWVLQLELTNQGINCPHSEGVTSTPSAFDIIQDTFIYFYALTC